MSGPLRRGGGTERAIPDATPNGAVRFGAGSVSVGVDAGGSSSRAVAVDASGAAVGRGRAGGANPNSNGLAAAAANVAAAVGAALAGRACAAVVLGMAGSSKLLAESSAMDAFVTALAGVGAPRPQVVSDAEVAFASGASEPDGAVLIAGTGSIGMRITGHRRAAVAGGYGWLLGDEGSAFWLGREAVRAALAALLNDGPPSPLVKAVLDRTGAHAFGELITVVNNRAPIALAEFAPLVSAHAGDPVADDIAERAATGLAGLARQVWRGGPVVLAGSVAAPGTPVGARLRRLLDGFDVRTADDGVLGAARLAAVAAFGEQTAKLVTLG